MEGQYGKLTLKPNEVSQRTGIGRNSVYDAINRGELRSIRIGRRILIPVEAVREWLDRLGSTSAS